jgi:hypothetical protein
MAIDRNRVDRELAALNEPDRDLIDPLLWDEVESSRGDSTWGVDDLGWDDLAPALPAEVAALLASPLAVTAEPLFFEDAGLDEDDSDVAPAGEPERPRWGNREASATYAACAPRFLAPAPLGARSRRSSRRVRTS